MLKRIGFIFTTVMLIFTLTACGCEHEWMEATCTESRTCLLCNETDGDPMGHLWVEATCETKQFCVVCEVEEGEALGHEWVEASCERAKHCVRCEIEEGEALEHAWNAPTCVDAMTCSLCGLTEGKPLGHDYSKMQTIKAASCTELGYAEGVCAVCGETTGQEIPMKEHKLSKWTTTVKETCTEDGEKTQCCANCDYTVVEVIPQTGHAEGEMKVTTKATYNSSGERTVSCKNCGEVLRSEEYKLTEAEAEKDYKSKCKTINYKDLCRNPKTYKDEMIKITGTVFQEVSEAENILEYSVYFVKSSGNLYCVLIDNYGSGSRILEDDRISIYGTVGDLLTYETVRGNSNTIPKIYAEYYN